MNTKTITIPARTEKVTFAQYVGRRIRERRKQLGLTLEDVVATADISKPFLSECETGKRSIGFSKICSVAKVLGKPTDWFAKGWYDE